MSKNLNVDLINTKLIEKYTKKDFVYHGFFEAYLNTPQQIKLLTELVEDVQNKKPFIPNMSTWFSEFDRLTPKNTKAVFIYYKNEEFSKEFQNFMNGITAKENIHLFPTARTHNSEKQHEDLWDGFNDYFLESMSQIPNMNYFFFGTTHHALRYNNTLKHILPDVNDIFWKSEKNVAEMQNEINNLIKLA